MENTRKINITVLIPDNDLIEYNFKNAVEAFIGKENLIDYRNFPDVDKHKDNPVYKELVKKKRSAGLVLDRWINENR